MTVQVVAAAITRDGAVFAARRAAPSRHAGGWEFPGGKVEAGESDAAALVRECREELAVDVLVGRRLGVALDGDLRVVLYAATLPQAEPTLGADHDDCRWLRPAEFELVDWLPVDRALLEPVAAHLL